MQRMILVGLAAALAAGASTAEAQRPRTIELPSRWMFNAHTVAALGTSVRDPLAIQTIEAGLSPQLALDGGVSVGTGTFGGNITVNGERFPVPRLERSTIARVMFGVNWYH